jgi:uncharacterized protein YbaR (Trm112 family)
MHIVLTDQLACPRCGSEFGLVVLADRMEGRQVVEGRLGCANCRDEYTIHGGSPDLRLGYTDPDWEPGGGDADRALRFAALLGIGHGPGTALVYGADARLLSGISELLPNARIVGAGPDDLAGAASAGIDWLMIGERIPLKSRSMRGVAFATPPGEALVREGLRILAPGGHFLVDPAPPGLADLLVGHGAELLLEQDGAAVASYSGRG